MARVAVVGGGIVGLAAALGLVQQKHQVTVFERQPEPMFSNQPQARVSALNHRSRDLLQQLGVWAELSQQRLGPYHGMEVWEHESFAHIEFHANHVDTDDLGIIVENELLAALLWRAAQQAGVKLYADAQVQLSGDSDIQYNDQVLNFDWVIAADGANSKLRQQCELPITFWDYEQQGLVALVRCAEPHGGIARQAFLTTGPLALLPTHDEHVVSIVWSCDEAYARELKALAATDEQAFAKALQVAADNTLGALELVSPLASFPLRMHYARQWLANRVVLLGDAAHGIHPLAGQGANLGFADVESLLKAFADEPTERTLKRYQRERKADAMVMIAAMEGFKRGFGTTNPLLKLARGAGFRLADNNAWLKRQFTMLALGRKE